MDFSVSVKTFFIDPCYPRENGYDEMLFFKSMERNVLSQEIPIFGRRDHSDFKWEKGVKSHKVAHCLWYCPPAQ
jgi:hypothetical protein